MKRPLEIGQRRKWVIPEHPTFGKHDADGKVFVVSELGNEDEGEMAKGDYENCRAAWCRTSPEWMVENSEVIE